MKVLRSKFYVPSFAIVLSAVVLGICGFPVDSLWLVIELFIKFMPTYQSVLSTTYTYIYVHGVCIETHPSHGHFGLI